MRKAFLAPYHPMVERIWLFALADAQAHTGVELHSGILVINHEHLTVTPTRDPVSEFLRRVHVDVSKALHCLLCELGYDAPREIFDDRPPHKMRLLDAEAMAAHYIYEKVNGVAAGLVTRPEHMPQKAIDASLWRAGGMRVERPPLYFHPRRRPAYRELRVTPHPELFHAFDGDLDALLYHLDRTGEHARRRLVDARNGRPPLGAKALRRIHPWSEPRTLRETGGRPVPTYKAGARGLSRARLEVMAAADTKRFRAEHRDARLARREGDLDAAFPYGTNKAVLLGGAPMCLEPYPDAVVTRPGRTLPEVKEALAREHALRAGSGGSDEAEPRDEHTRLMREVRDAFDEEAGELVQELHIELPRRTKRVVAAGRTDSSRATADARSADSDTGKTATVEVRHRLDPRPRERSPAARIVTLRDRRRGRPPKGGRHGGDPPS